MKHQAYWISPLGAVVPVDTQDGTHISKVYQNPERFDITRDRIVDAYRAHGERLLIEGKAREEIMRQVIKSGWVRVRYKPREAEFRLEFFEWSSRTRSQVKKWTRALQADPSAKVPSWTRLQLVAIEGKYERVTDFEEFR